MNKKEQFLSFLISIEKRLPKVYPAGDPRNEILVWVPQSNFKTKDKNLLYGRYYLSQAGVFVEQQKHLKENPEILDKLNKEWAVFSMGYYGTHWMYIYKPEEE